MSIHTLKLKSNRYQEKVSGLGSTGFSLVGGYRNLSYVGQTNLSKSVTRTRFRGNYPMGHGGNNGNYKISIANSGSCGFNDNSIIKTPVGNTKYAIIHKNKWLHSAYPRYVTKSCEAPSQSDYIKSLSTKTSKCNMPMLHGLKFTVYSGVFGLADPPGAYDFINSSPPILEEGASLNFTTLSTTTNGTIDNYVTNSEEEDNVSVYLRGYFRPKKTGLYTFYEISDDGCYIFIDGNLLINDAEEAHGPVFEISNTYNMVAGNYYFIEIFFRESSGGQAFTFSYNEPGSSTLISDTTNLFSYFQELPPSELDNQKRVLDCETSTRCKQGSYYIGGRKYVSTLYSKITPTYAISSSDYQKSRLMKKNDLPTPDCKKPFPFIVNNIKRVNFGGTHLTILTPEDAIAKNYLPADWMNCSLNPPPECFYGTYEYNN